MAGIIELKVNNFKRISAVELSFEEGKATTIAGRNGQGKSSILDAIVAAMCGKNHIDEVPVKVGEDQATIVCVVSTDPPLKIVRKIATDGSSSLTLTQKVGKIESKVSKPQQTLDGLLGKISFDPLEFTRQKPAAQMDILKDIVGIDTGGIDIAIADEVKARKNLKREVDDLRSNMNRMEFYPDTPREGVVVSELMEQLEKKDEERVFRDGLLERVTLYREGVISDESKLAQLKIELSELEASIEQDKITVTGLADDLSELKEVDTQPVRDQINQADEVNRKVRSNIEFKEIESSLSKKEDAVELQTKTIEELRGKKLKMMDEAKWPVDGIGFSNSGVIFNDLPFSQCSSAEQYKISTAIGLSQNPEIRLMMIRDGSLLDDDSMRVMEQLANEHNSQILIERVGTGQADEIVIEDGTVYQPEADPAV